MILKYFEKVKVISKDVWNCFDSWMTGFGKEKKFQCFQEALKASKAFSKYKQRINLKGGIINKLNLGLVQKPSFRVDLKNRDWVLSY